MNDYSNQLYNEYGISRLTWYTGIKYVVEALAIVLVLFVIPRRELAWSQIAAITFVAVLTFFILDLVSPATGAAYRSGIGHGAGLQFVTSPPTKVPFPVSLATGMKR